MPNPTSPSLLPPPSPVLPADSSVARLSVLVALASVLQVAEALLPYPVPGIRLGLANMVTLIALAEISPLDAFRLALLRSLIGSLILGTFLTPTFVLSFSGAMASAALMVACYYLSRAVPVLRLSLVGISVVGSVAHVLTQVVVVYLVFVRSSGVLLLAPWLVLSGVVMGIITGLAAIQVCRRLAAGSPGPVTDARRVAVLAAPEGRYVRAHSPLHRLRPEAKLIAVLLLALAVVLVRSPVFYAALLAALLGLTLLARVRFAALMYNLRRLATFMVLTFLLPLLFTPSGRVLFALGPVRVTLAGLATGGILTLRILLLFLATSLLALTTRPEGIATGLENLLSPLRFVGIRSRSLARVLGLSWSFFPVLWQHAQEMLRRRDSRRRGLSGIAGFLPDLVTDLYVEAELLASGTAEPDPQ